MSCFMSASEGHEDEDEFRAGLFGGPQGNEGLAGAAGHDDRGPGCHGQLGLNGGQGVLLVGPSVPYGTPWGRRLAVGDIGSDRLEMPGLEEGEVLAADGREALPQFQGLPREGVRVGD
jgi:hypothetical protein